MYNFGSNDGYCFIWNESIACKGACEIASCVYSFIKTMSESGKKIFSDNCSAQNKNRFYVAMLWYAIQKFNLTCIQHKYLEKGHTQNENDSIHATVEASSRHVSVYSTSQWAACIRASRRKHPYIDKEMDLCDFLDFKALADNLKNFDLDMDRSKVQWKKIKTLKINEENPNIVHVQYDYNGAVHQLDLLYRARKIQDLPNADQISLTQLRHDNPKILFRNLRTWYIFVTGTSFRVFIIVFMLYCHMKIAISIIHRDHTEV